VIFAPASSVFVTGVLPAMSSSFVHCSASSVASEASVLSMKVLPSVSLESVSATFSAPIEPEGSDWDGAIALRNRTRAEILRLCAEPDLGEETELGPQPAA